MVVLRTGRRQRSHPKTVTIIFQDFPSGVSELWPRYKI